MPLNTLNITGKVQGKMVKNKNNDGKHFEGNVGDLPIWLFGRAGEQAEQYMDTTVLATGLINSRTSDKGNHFVSPVVFGLLPANPNTEHNLVAFEGTIQGVRRIKEGFYQADVVIQTTAWENKKRVSVEQTIPVATGNVTESDIGKTVSVVGEINVREGRFIDIRPQQFHVEGTPAIEEDGDDDLDDLL